MSNGRQVETTKGEPLEYGLPVGTVEGELSRDTEVVNSKGKQVPPTSVPFPTNEYTSFQRKPLESKREYLKAQWLDIAFITLWKGKLFARSVTKKDFGKLVQLLMSAGISWDKVFPKGETPSSLNLAINLFNGLPTSKTLDVIGTVDTPSTIDVPIVTEAIVPKGES